MIRLKHERTETTVSEEKKVQSKAVRGEKRRREEQKDRRTTAIYSVIGVIVLVAAAALLVWRSGVLQRSLTALEVNGVKYTAADVQYYYQNAYSSHANNYEFDSGSSVKRQVYDQETGQSWHDYLKQEAISDLTDYTALAARADSEGYTLTQDAQSELDTMLNQLNAAWISYGYSSRDSFIRANFGPYMTYDRLVSLLRTEYLATDYAAAQLDAISHPDSDYDAYYQAHTDELDTIVYTQFTLQAQVSSTDAQGSAAEMTDQEKAAALETLKTEQKALAEEIKAKLEAGADPEDIAEQYEGQLYSTSLSRRSTGTNVSYSSYGSWLLDAARRPGDITLTERDSGSAYYYYVAIFEDRLLDQENTHDVRHLLIRAGSGTAEETPTQEQYDEAEERANTLLEEWRSGEATEDSFSALASANSDDTGSASGGGLISNITSTSSYVESFRSWAVDPARKPGDAGLVKSEYGWHIMYYVGTNDPIWKQTAGSSLLEQDYEQLAADAARGWNISQGIGMNFISA